MSLNIHKSQYIPQTNYEKNHVKGLVLMLIFIWINL